MKVVQCSRAFVSHMYATAAKLKETHFYVRLNAELHSDLCWWHTLLTEWNGLSLLHWDDNNWIPNHLIQTDASRAWGYDAFWDGQWLK